MAAASSLVARFVPRPLLAPRDLSPPLARTAATASGRFTLTTIETFMLVTFHLQPFFAHPHCKPWLLKSIGKINLKLSLILVSLRCCEVPLVRMCHALKTRATFLCRVPPGSSSQQQCLLLLWWTTGECLPVDPDMLAYSSKCLTR